MQPYIEAQYVKIAFLIVISTGTIHDACREWQCCTPVNQTWADFRHEFARAQREQRVISSTASGTGYHTFNVAEYYVHNSIPADSGFVTAMANLATAISADRLTVATLTKAIAILTDKLKAKYIWAKSQEAELKPLLGGHISAAPIVPTTPGSAYVRKSYKTKMTTTVGRMGIRLGWLIQV
jgi:hypothetical protein